MNKEQEQLEALKDIRKMMQESTRFLSLSGLSGVCAGVFALGGAWVGHVIISDFTAHSQTAAGDFEQRYHSLVWKIIGICALVLTLSIGTAFYYTAKKAKKNGQNLFDRNSVRLLSSVLIPLLTGGAFCLSLLLQGKSAVLFVAPSMLLFYGLALYSASRFTLHDIKYLSFFEIALGLCAAFFTGHGLLFWALGFGVMHIIYGSIMWFKYDRK